MFLRSDRTMITIFTICSANYLPYARTLHASLTTSNPQIRFMLFLVDEVRDRFPSRELGFDVVEVKDVGCANLFDMAARYSIMEMNTAVKPFCFQHLFESESVGQAIYLDPDILVTSELSELLALLAKKDVDIVLTPHSTSPLCDGRNPNDVQLMRAGAYNLGFCAVKRSINGTKFLDWWGKHLTENCVVDVANGVFVDQKFCDLVPCYFSNVHIFRHEGYNVAYWNLLGREVALDSGWTANGLPLRFFHFSGVIPGNHSVFSKHQDRFTVETIGAAARALLESYLKHLDKYATLAGVNLFTLEYFYGRLANGMRLTDDMRRVYRKLYLPRDRSYEDAFSGYLGRYLTFSPDISSDPEAPVTALMYSVWNSRDDLRRAFHLGSAEGRRSFLSWFQSTASTEHNVPAEIVKATALLGGQEVSHSRTVSGIGMRGEEGLIAPSGESEWMNWAKPRTISASSEVGLAMFGYHQSDTGLGAAVRANFRAAKSAGLAVFAWEFMGAERKIVPEYPIERDELPVYDCVLFHMNADETTRIETRVDPRILNGRHRIGYWVWELDSLPIEWRGAYEKVDEIWCPSNFSARVFGQRTDQPITVIPHPVATPPFIRNVELLRRKFGLPRDGVIFLAAFDVRSYIQRKNPEGVVRAFRRAMEGRNEEAILVIKLHGGSLATKQGSELLRLIGADKRIKIIDAVMPAHEVGELQACCDAFISLHRAEGFGLWIAECMARGKPCVVTNYSGNTDYTDNNNSMPIGFTMAKVGDNQYPYGEGRWWAEPDEDEAVYAIRSLVASESLRRALGDSARSTIARKLSFEAVGAMMARRLYAARAEMFELPRLVVSMQGASSR